MSARKKITQGGKRSGAGIAAEPAGASAAVDTGSLSLLSWRDYDSDGRDTAAEIPRRKMARAKITPKKVTLRMIAQAVGLSHVAVSLALRNHASIPEQTRERVQETAQKMGYQPDPMLSALNAYRRTRQAVRYQATLILVNPYNERSALDRSINFNRYRLGAMERAQELGFALEEFWLAQPGMSAQRFHQILKARQVQGVLLLPAPYSYVFPDVQWGDVSVVQFGFSQAPLFHLVTNAQFRSIRLCVQRLHGLGYRRIGMVSYRIPLEFKAGLWSGAEEFGVDFTSLQMPSDDFDESNCALLRDWVRKHRLDAVIGFDGLCEALRSASLRVPEDIAVAVLNASSGQSTQAGIDQCSHQIGRVAVEQLARMIQNNERGFPSHPLRILVDSVWVDGASAPPKATPAVQETPSGRKKKPAARSNAQTPAQLASSAEPRGRGADSKAKRVTASKKRGTEPKEHGAEPTKGGTMPKKRTLKSVGVKGRGKQS